MKTPVDNLSKLPRAIAVDLRSIHAESPFGVVVPGESGFRPIYPPTILNLKDEEDAAAYLVVLDEMVMETWKTRKPTPEEREAAVFGSMFGWDKPGANPDSYKKVAEKKTIWLVLAVLPRTDLGAGQADGIDITAYTTRKQAEQAAEALKEATELLPEDSDERYLDINVQECKLEG